MNTTSKGIEQVQEQKFFLRFEVQSISSNP